ncbi:MAG: hypothetical protein OXB86_05700 [Bdellovibrionales bacterium]|nr:hypothetical protein [Bdellovibrionales bacterium]
MRTSLNHKFAPFNQWKAILQAFQEARFSLLWVFKKLTYTFGLFWLPLAAIIFFSVNYLLPGYPITHVKLSLSLFEVCFTVFLVPYFAYKFIQTKKGIPVETFKEFLTETITPLIFASIKAMLVILRHLIILFVPGVIKLLRLSLLHYTVFFDPRVRTKKLSPLEAAQETTKGVLLSIIVIYMIFILIELYLPKGLFHLLTIGVTSEDLFLNSMANTLTYCFIFYLHAFKYTVMTHFYFILRDRK